MKTASEGTLNQIVISCFLMNAPGLRSSFCDGLHTQAPRSHAVKRSKTDPSNVVAQLCENRSCSVTFPRPEA